MIRINILEISKRKQSSMDSFLINKSVKQHDRSDTLSEEDADNSELCEDNS